MAVKKTLNIERYGILNVEEVGDLTYIGKQDIVGNWLIIKMDESSGLSILYGTKINNPSIMNYVEGWEHRGTDLVYGDYKNLYI
jgi:hypothetical protein